MEQVFCQAKQSKERVTNEDPILSDWILLRDGLATVIGQTGDWDILSAGLAVAVVEGIGALMYRASFAFLGRIRNMITIFNYWKAGLTLGLFLDSFKYEVDELLESCNPFNFEINIFAGLW